MNYITESDRIYATDLAGKTIAEITFPSVGDEAIITHTFVDPSLRGQGIAGQLVQRAVDEILSQGKKVRATCPYAVDWLKKHPGYTE